MTYDEVDQLLPDADLALAVKSNLAVMRTLEEVIERLEKTVKARVKRDGLRFELCLYYA